MKLSTILGPLYHYLQAIKVALIPTLKDIWRTPVLIFSPAKISRLFFARVWKDMGSGMDEAGRDVKLNLLPTNAYGIVLDLGAGHGHTANYLDRARVTKYIALEPNTMMHPEIIKSANANGFTEADGTFIILSCGAEDINSVLAVLGEPHSVDTIVSILTLCSIPSPEQTLTVLVRDVLKPGGTLVFYEHVLSHREDVARWQRIWTPFWKLAFDGCRLDRPSHLWIERMGLWKDGEVWGKEEEEEESMFWHRIGKFVKA